MSRWAMRCIAGAAAGGLIAASLALSGCMREISRGEFHPDGSNVGYHKPRYISVRDGSPPPRDIEEAMRPPKEDP